MIKIIATDMDGTLLTPQHKLPIDFYKTLEELNKRNIEFVIASGRSYTAITGLFENYLDKLDFICDNGAFIVRDGEVKEVSVINFEKVKEIVEVCHKMEGATPVLCGKKGTYFDRIRSKQEFIDEVANFYISIKAVDDLLNIDDEIFKIAVCDMKNPINNSYPVLSSIFGDNFNIQVSGAKWLDVMNKGINKGNALEKIKASLNISYDETMAFGDYYNDIELLKQAKYSFVMENANSDMKKYGNFIAESNINDGVIKAINKHILEVN